MTPAASDGRAEGQGQGQGSQRFFICGVQGSRGTG